MAATADATVAPRHGVALRHRAATSLRAFASVFANRALRRLQLAWAASVIGQWSFFVALGVFAFEAGGTAGVGLAGLLRVLPPAIAGVFVGGLGDRFPRARVMVVSDLSRVLLLGSAAALIAGEGPPVIVYALAGLAGLAATAFRPAQAATMPSLTDRPEELTAANLVASTIEGLGVFVGPALGGVLLAATSAEVVFAFAAAASVASAALLTGLLRRAPQEHVAAEPGGIVTHVLEGLTTVARDGRLRVIVGLPTALAVVWGAVAALVVLIGLRLLGSDESTVGFLNAAIGLGAVLGGFVTLSLVGARRLAPGFGLSILLWSVPLLAVAAWPSVTVAAICLGLVGIGNTLAEVTSVTMVQRAVPERVLARVFALQESLLYAGIGLGSVMTPVVVDAVGVRGALAVFAVPMIVLLAATWRRLLAVERAATPPTDRLALLRQVPTFAPLGGPALEWLAAALVPLEVGRDEVVARQGEPGEVFYIVADGELEVQVDGAHARVLAPGGSFGEVALLRDVPRTATVAARKQGARLFALDRNAFLAAVMANPESARAASDVASARLAAFRPSGFMA